MNGTRTPSGTVHVDLRRGRATGRSVAARVVVTVRSSVGPGRRFGHGWRPFEAQSWSSLPRSDPSPRLVCAIVDARAHRCRRLTAAPDPPRKDATPWENSPPATRRPHSPCPIRTANRSRSRTSPASRWWSTSTRGTTPPDAPRRRASSTTTCAPSPGPRWRVLGISGDSAEKHRAFRAKYGLKFPLLTDADHTVGEAYGAWGEKTLYGKKSVGVIRSTFLIAAGRDHRPALVPREGGRSRGQGSGRARGVIPTGHGGSVLVRRTPPRGPAPDRRPDQLGAVARAPAPGVAFLHQVPEVRAAPLGELGDGPDQMAVGGAVPRRWSGTRPVAAATGRTATAPRRRSGSRCRPPATGRAAGP